MRTPAGTLAFRAAAALAALLAAGAAACLALLLLSPARAAALGGLTSNAWWFLYREGAPGTGPAAAWRVAAAAIAAVLGLAAALRCNALYRRGGAPLLPGLTAFFLALSLECLRAAAALLYAADGSVAAGVVLTRVIYWGRFVGLLSLLVAGLYGIEMAYRRHGVLAGVVFLVAFAVAAYIPMDRTVFLAQLTWKLGDEQGVWFVNLVIGLLVLVTTTLAAVTRKDRRWLWIAIAMALLLASRELLCFAVTPIPLAAGVAALLAGAVVSLRVVGVMYPAKE